MYVRLKVWEREKEDVRDWERERERKRETYEHFVISVRRTRNVCVIKEVNVSNLQLNVYDKITGN